MKKVIDKLFELRQKHKNENIDFMHLLVKLNMNSLCGEQVHKDIDESYSFQPET